jgi:hypothetical protein
MSMWFLLYVNEAAIGSFEAQRHEPLDLTDRAALADAVCTYTIRVDGRDIGTVRHRYGDGAWQLARAGLDLLTGDTARRTCRIQEHQHRV